ncbi:hypothetical protein FRC05_006839 [Tulasnella sp. 425]|nr:hypothetical protein FRC05_006839 [Tulasnella sp. 425]
MNVVRVRSLPLILTTPKLLDVLRHGWLDPEIDLTVSQMRGELKTIARLAVETVFGFIPRESKALSNKKLYERLINGNIYLYKKWQDAGNPKGMWFNEILFNIVRKMWFKSSKDDGILYSTHFDPVQTETMALTYTAVRCALDEWKDGSLNAVNFTALSYEAIYQDLFAGLVSLKRSAEGEEVVKDLGEELWTESSSGLVERRQLLTNSFSQAQHSAAVRDVAACKARKQAEAEVDAAILLDY